MLALPRQVPKDARSGTATALPSRALATPTNSKALRAYANERLLSCNPQQPTLLLVMRRRKKFPPARCWSTRLCLSFYICFCSVGFSCKWRVARWWTAWNHDWILRFKWEDLFRSWGGGLVDACSCILLSSLWEIDNAFCSYSKERNHHPSLSCGSPTHLLQWTLAQSRAAIYT
jgi:hypothetical protein